MQVEIWASLLKFTATVAAPKSKIARLQQALKAKPLTRYLGPFLGWPQLPVQTPCQCRIQYICRSFEDLPKHTSLSARGAFLFSLQGRVHTAIPVSTASQLLFFLPERITYSLLHGSLALSSLYDQNTHHRYCYGLDMTCSLKAHAKRFRGEMTGLWEPKPLILWYGLTEQYP